MKENERKKDTMGTIHNTTYKSNFICSIIYEIDDYM